MCFTAFSWPVLRKYLNNIRENNSFSICTNVIVYMIHDVSRCLQESLIDSQVILMRYKLCLSDWGNLSNTQSYPKVTPCVLQLSKMLPLFIELESRHLRQFYSTLKQALECRSNLGMSLLNVLLVFFLLVFYNNDRKKCIESGRQAVG